jgi:DNA repair photolyase
VLLDPILPGLTDTRENLVPLLDALAERGVTRITAGYLALTPNSRSAIEAELGSVHWAQPLLTQYEKGPTVRFDRQVRAQLLPRRERERGYATLIALGAERGITVRINAMTNPDFSPPPTHWRQPSLFRQG